MTALQPITVSIQEAKRITGLSHVTIYKLMKEGRVRYTKVGRRTLVSYASLVELLNPVNGLDRPRSRSSLRTSHSASRRGELENSTPDSTYKLGLNSGLRRLTAAKS